ncbi:MAG: LysR family transcriptional regulator [Gammaproteobacteria bacterium]|jgi:DNA-binding transcriptional LysR family regulator
MRLTLDALAVLDAIDRKGSFAAAAEVLHRVPSAITYTVQKLEQDLGVELFDRSGHRARLTPAGQLLLKEGRHLLRTADDLEGLVKRTATGWETELNIAVDDLIPLERFYPLFEAFYAEGNRTRLRVGTEVLGGSWDALTTRRAELVIGATGDPPPFGGYASRVIGSMRFVFVVPPGHPLADAPEPLTEDQIRPHRVVAAADSSRDLPPRTVGLAGLQDVFTVSGMRAKCEAHRHGLGVGHVPEHYVRDDLAEGRLITKRLEGGLPCPQLYVAWRTDRMGKALGWFLERLESPDWFEGLLV